MKKRKQRDIIHRWEGNPAITIQSLPFKASDIWNAGAVRVGDTYILIVTIESLSGHKDLYCARSENGYHFTVDAEPFMIHAEDSAFSKYEKISIMDARITYLDDTYYISYIGESEYGFRIGLAKTDDFKKATRLNFISEVDTKGGALFPEKINGRYARLERPADGGRIWISYSDDLVCWGGSEAIMSPRKGFWDASRIGDAVPPMRISDGRWLMIYYGIKETSAGPLFRIGAALLDAKDPSKVVARTNIPILSPREMYERVGDITNLVFSCGAVLDGDNLLLYYGAAKSCLCVGITTLDDIVNECIESEGVY